MNGMEAFLELCREELAENAWILMLYPEKPAEVRPGDIDVRWRGTDAGGHPAALIAISADGYTGTEFFCVGENGAVGITAYRLTAKMKRKTI